MATAGDGDGEVQKALIELMHGSVKKQTTYEDALLSTSDKDRKEELRFLISSSKNDVSKAVDALVAARRSSGTGAVSSAQSHQVQRFLFVVTLSHKVAVPPCKFIYTLRPGSLQGGRCGLQVWDS
jgi:hypothetical protein